MRVFTLISSKGEGIALAQRIVAEGHRVQFYINNPKARGVGDGLVEKHAESGVLVGRDGRVDNEVFNILLTPHPDCLIFTVGSIGFAVAADRYRKLGFPCVGASEWGGRLESDVEFSRQVIKAVKISTALVQGVRIFTSLWFNGSDVVGVTHSINDNHLMESSKGPEADMGCVLWTGSTESRLFKESIGKLLPLLRKVGYIGQLGIASIVDEKTHCGLFFSTHFDCGRLAVLLEMYKGRANDLMYGIATGVIKHMPFKSKLGIGITIAVLPFPLDATLDTVNVKGLNKYNLKHFWGYDLCKTNGEYTTSNNGGRIGTITARGDEIQGFSPLRDAKRRAMRTISNLDIDGLMYRSDIGNSVEAKRAKLKEWNWT